MAYVDVRNLRISLRLPGGMLEVVRGIDLQVDRGEIFGIVGESGSGKTMATTALLGLGPPNAVTTADRMEVGGLDLAQGKWSGVRGRKIAMIFQDPAASLNPVFRVGAQMDQVLRKHTALGRAARRARCLQLLDEAGLPDPDRVLRLYPHQMSGGMQQRVLIALTLSAGADLLIADEPTTALDVTVQAQILALLRSLRDRHGLTILFISHDLGIIAQFCDQVAVMRQGRVVEQGRVSDVLHAPQHPYTRALLAAIPGRSPRGAALPTLASSLTDGD
jgi:ABC-type dipeptide/oligopeptide/nickel transport system ATPase component